MSTALRLMAFAFLTLAAVAKAQIQSCPSAYFDPPTPCKSKCGCGNGPPNGPNGPSGGPDSKRAPNGNSDFIQDPILSLSQGSFHQALDLDVEVPFGSTWFSHRYHSDPELFSSRNTTSYENCLFHVPVPFGRFAQEHDQLLPDGGLYTTHNGPAIKWMPNLFSYVCSAGAGGQAPYFDGASDLAVTDIWGERLRFTTCQTPPCVTHATASTLTNTSRMLKLDGGYVVVDETGLRMYYQDYYLSDAGSKLHFLSKLEDAEGRTFAVATYANPLRPDGGLCSEGLGPNLGVPYLDKFISPSTKAGLSFTWTELERPDLTGGRDCVLSGVRIRHADGGIGHVVNFSYRNNRTGYLESVSGGLAPETYDYDGGFGVKYDAVYTSFHPLNPNLPGQADGSRVAGPAFDISWVDNVAVTCAEGTCCNPGGGERQFIRSANYLNENVGKFSADFSSEDPGFVRKWSHTRLKSQYSQYPLVAREDSCTLEPSSCSAGTEFYAWRNVDAGAFCGTNDDFREMAYRNKLGNWFVEGITKLKPDAGPWGTSVSVWERRLFARGSASIDSTNPLEVSRNSYGYTTDLSAQVVTAVETSSVVQAGSNAGTYYRYSPGTAHLEAMYRSGYTVDLTGTAQARTVATFYGADGAGRVVSIEGPCDVTDLNATSCSGTRPRTELSYYADTNNGDNAGRLFQVKQYPLGCPSSGCSTTPLVTTYSNYTAAGDPQLVTDANDAGTSYTYNEARELTARSVSGRTWSYTWEHHKLTRIQYPSEVNSEFFCYRSGSNCNGTWLRNLQWQAKIGSSVSDWSEKIVYDYWPSDALKSMTFHASGEAYPRRQQWFDEDAQQRPTARRIGTGNGSFTEKKAWDGANNLAAVGLAFNTGAPDFCKTGGALDEKCAWLKHDRANRLTELDVFPDGTNGSQIRSCFDHDGQGNIVRVSMACDAGATCNFDGGPSACSLAANDYKHDDFGNVIEANVANTANDAWTPGTGKGWVRYSYNAFGNVTADKFGGGGQAVYTTRTYDYLGRLITVSSSPYEVFTFAYDDPSVAPSGCGTLTNTRGRLVMRADAYWKTYYSYDAEGRVIREARHSNFQGADCPSPALDTVYTYSANGNLASIRYPHGRTVTYVYPSSGAGIDRATSISVTLHNGTNFSSPPGTTLIDNIAWEPYSGLRAYVNKHDAGTTSTVEYMLGDDSSQPHSSGYECDNTVPSASSSDYTARLRSLRVSNGSGIGGSGDIFKRLYTWQADQVTRMDTCYRSDGLPLTELIGYDNTLRVKAVAMPNFTTSGGFGPGQSYLYDQRGNMTRLYIDDAGHYNDMTYEAAAHTPDRLLREGDGGFAHSFVYDSDGFTYFMSTPNKTADESGSYITFARRAAGTYSALYVTSPGVGASFYYDYDAFNRRYRKAYAADTSDWFFYDTDHQLLEDLGVATTVYPGTPYPIDEYVWLDGRPVAVIRAKMDASLARSADGTGTCARNGRPAACDTFFITTDHIGKPVLSLDGRRLITGVGEYEPFGAMNRSEYRWGTDWTYGADAGDSAVVPTQRAHGLTTAFRAHFTRFDSEQTCTGGFVDGIQASDNNAGIDSGSDCVPTPSGLVSWWRGEGNSNDTGPNGNHGSLSGGALFGIGKVGLGFHFDGYGGTRFSAPTNGLPVGGSDRTIEFWAQIDGVSPGSPTAESAWFAGYGTFGYYNECYAAVAWAPGFYSSGFSSFFSQWGASLNGPTLSTGSWYHIAVTTSDGYSTFWVNGVAQESGYLTVDTPSGTTFFMGGIDALGDITRLKGSVDELSVYDRALSESEINSIYAAGSAGKCGCGNYSGQLGESWTTWCPARESDAGYSEYRLNWHTNATNCQPGNCSCGDAGTLYAGFSMRDYEYQRYQQAAGAQMYFPPLRFPGQYFDEETHLHENWNRSYFPTIGRYLQPEPLQQTPMQAARLAGRGFGTPTYAYALNNPVYWYDLNGLDVDNRGGTHTLLIKQDDKMIKLPPGGYHPGDQDGFAYEDDPGNVFKTVDGIDAKCEGSDVSTSGGSPKQKAGQWLVGGWKDRNSPLNRKHPDWRPWFRRPPDPEPREPRQWK